MTVSEDDGCEGWQQQLEEGGHKGDAELLQAIIFFCEVVES